MELTGQGISLSKGLSPDDYETLIMHFNNPNITRSDINVNVRQRVYVCKVQMVNG